MATEEHVEGSKTLGLDRWVQFGFIATAAVAFWLYDKIIITVWDQLALFVNAVPEPNGTTVSLIAAVLGVLTGYLLYRHEEANAFVNESAAELSKVTWPTRKETWSNTVVTVITSIIAAIILFMLDATWSAITDLIYKV